MLPAQSAVHRTCNATTWGPCRKHTCLFLRLRCYCILAWCWPAPSTDEPENFVRHTVVIL